MNAPLELAKETHPPHRNHAIYSISSCDVKFVTQKFHKGGGKCFNISFNLNSRLHKEPVDNSELKYTGMSRRSRDICTLGKSTKPALVSFLPEFDDGF